MLIHILYCVVFILIRVIINVQNMYELKDAHCHNTPYLLSAIPWQLLYFFNNIACYNAHTKRKQKSITNGINTTHSFLVIKHSLN